MVKLHSIYQSKQCGPMKVIGMNKKRNDTYIVQFENTGTIKECRGFAILEGSVRDPYARLVCGVGCTGNIKTKGKYKPYYSIWHDMINRCYNPKDKRHQAYVNVSVATEWLVFENFYNDCALVDGFDAPAIESGEKVLDKDLKQRFALTKIYSKDTCTWVTKKQNALMQDMQQRPFVAISPDGKSFEDYNITRFAQQHGLTRKHISGVLHNRAKTTGGWKFFYKEIV